MVLERNTIIDGLIAHSSEEQKQVWGLREGITESLQQKTLVKKFDVAVPVAGMLAFLKDVESTFNGGNYEFDLYIFGHYGDGSPHLNLLKRAETKPDRFLSEYDRFHRDLFTLLLKHEGSISAEHGVGILKKEWVKYSRSQEELRIFKLIKTAFDPHGLLNPGKVMD